MADLNPMEPGDVPYPQYSVVTTEEIFAGTTVTKGGCFTKNATGELIPFAADSSNGIFQATATPEVNPSIAGDTVQVLGPRTRMIFEDAVGGLVVGEDVVKPSGDPFVVTGLKSAINYVGKVFEIYTRNTDATRKKVTVATDFVVVETVQA